MFTKPFFCLCAAIVLCLLSNSLFAQWQQSSVDSITDTRDIEMVVITGSLKPENKNSSPIAIDVYTPTFLRKNPTSNLFEALQNIHGVRPQINCNICNTGDIHINGLEGPYTMVLIDGMPLVSGLSSVYGLSGIPSALIQRLEIVKGPASALFGSEAVGGLIHIVTKKASQAPKLAVEQFGTSHGEYNTDVGLRQLISKRMSLLTGINHYFFQCKIDQNNDHFTDVAPQHRLSVFQKWNYERPYHRNFQWATRIYTEDRWGGDVKWTHKDRGGSKRYGESIYTDRVELYGQYQLPVHVPINLSLSASSHRQNSYYGINSFQAKQKIVFGQCTMHPTWQNSALLLGVSWRYTQYKDNTAVHTSPLITSAGISKLEKPFHDTRNLPGLFVQWEKSQGNDGKILAGLRLDHHAVHGNIFTPRIALKHKVFKHTFRWNLGSGFRVVNVFTEDHAALTGARVVILNPQLQPEKSINGNLQILRTTKWKNRASITKEFTVFYTHFQNRILPNYAIHPNEIHYNNLDGFAFSRGISGKIDIQTQRITLSVGTTWMNVSLVQNRVISQPLLTEKLNATAALSWKIPKTQWLIDYTSNICSPMALPLLGPLDPRPASSPWWAQHNIQFTTENSTKKWSFFLGAKNLFNFTPAKSTPFLIARSQDPFDQQVVFDSQKQPVATNDNPYALSFDPSYVYAPNQGRRVFIGYRLNLNQ